MVIRRVAKAMIYFVLLDDVSLKQGEKHDPRQKDENKEVHFQI